MQAVRGTLEVTRRAVTFERLVRCCNDALLYKRTWQQRLYWLPVGDYWVAVLHPRSVTCTGKRPCALRLMQPAAGDSHAAKAHAGVVQAGHACAATQACLLLLSVQPPGRQQVLCCRPVALSPQLRARCTPRTDCQVTPAGLQCMHLMCPQDALKPLSIACIAVSTPPQDSPARAQLPRRELRALCSSTCR